MLKTGLTLDSRYELGRILGRGSASEVWSARDLHDGRELAVKAPKPSSRTPAVTERFEQEGHAMGLLESPFICPCLAVGHLPDGAPYLVFERLYGQTLGDRLRKERFLSMEDAAWIVDDVLQALVCAHAAGVIHRDLSPTNLFLEETKSGKLRIKVLDFGMSKLRVPRVPFDKAATGNFGTIGTVAYAAPEQLGDATTVTARADLYGLGTILFRMLAGRLPFGDATGPELVLLKRDHDAASIDEATGDKWPIAITGFLRRMLTRAPARRYPSAEVALAGWRAACATLSGMTPQYDSLEVSGERDAVTLNPSTRRYRR